MDEITVVGFLDELEKIGASPADLTLGVAAKKLLSSGKSVLGGAAAGAGHLWEAARKGSTAAAQHLESSGSRLGRTAGTAARLAPYVGAAYGVDKVLSSRPVQSIRARLSSGQNGQGGYYQ